MNKDQIHEAIEEMKGNCDLRMEGYVSLSARDCLYELHYEKAEADEILTALHGAGFNYCLDPIFPSRELGENVPTPAFACVWGPDQLRSRLECINL